VSWTPLAAIPEDFIHFIWASEDQAFFDHGGFDLDQLNKAIAEAKKTGKSVRGSSTITMQCARSVFLWQGRSYIRKGLEAYYTFWMELFLSKKRILELYLNGIEFGPGIYGIGAAAREYFDRDPARLSRSQMIALAAILPNPLKWSPVKPNETVRQKIRRIERLSSRAPFPDGELR
jgi:monofunctional biosynthetic peptidoglycan transglycosylase